MRTKHLTFEQATAAWLDVAEGFNAIPEQPSRELSKCQGEVWIKIQEITS